MEMSNIFVLSIFSFSLLFLCQATTGNKVIHAAGHAALFDGVNDYIAVTPNCGASVGFQNQAVTVMAWVNVSSDTTLRDM